MKNITLTLLIAIIATAGIFAQAPDGINYQTIIRDADGQILDETELSLQMTIRAGAPDGDVVYSEIHEVTTNTFGLVNLVIGAGQPETGEFSEIDWGATSHFLETAVDLEGNGEFEILGVSQFLSVPYSLYSGQTGDTTKWQKNENVIYYNQGQVGVGTSQPDSSALLDVNSKSQGFLPPRMTSEERDSIQNPAAGLIVFNLNTHCINFYNGVEWVEYGRDPMDTFECGQIFTDPRDNQQYRTVQIGEQCWYSENLNYGNKVNASNSQTDNGQVEKYCYDNSPAICLEYGGLYQWDEMMAYDTIEFTQGICPEGWHLPNQAEWQILIDTYGGASLAGNELVSTGTSGFDALMNGKYESVAGFSGKDDLSTFWSSTGIPGATGTGFDIENGNAAVNTSNAPVSNAYGVRCLQGLPNRADPNLRVIDTTVYLLISDSLELSQGIYRYEIIGSRKSKDIIVADNIVVGTENYGYLRKVEESTINGNEMTLITMDADMEDTFVEGEFDFGSELTGKNKPVFSYTRIIYTAPGVEISPTKDGFHYEFYEVPLFIGNNITVSIPQGHLTLDPSFEFEFKFKNKKVKRLAFYADETLFENSLDVEVEVTAQTNDTKEITLAKIEKYLIFLVPSIPPIPIVIVITTELICEFSYNFAAAFYATTGYTNTNTLTFGMKYEYGDWQRIWNFDKSTQLHPFNWEGNVALNQGLQLIPQISVELYGIAGPYFNLPLWEELEANLAMPDMNYDAKLDVGLNGNIGAAITILGKTLASYNKELFGFEKNLYNTPSEIEMISGNNQTGNINNQLPEPLKLKVTDNLGLTYVPAMVHFSVETGGGTLSEVNVWTDENGYAQTFWTLGNLEGNQEIKAEVKKANGQNITGSPSFFTAIAEAGGGQCGQPFTDPRDGQTYETVLIGTHCWMAENLNIGTRIDGSEEMTDNGTIEKYCYDNYPANCDVYGGLYQWDEIMQYTTTQGVQGICPEGWKLPTDDECKILEGTVDSQYGVGDPEWDGTSWRGYDAGTNLKYGGSSGFEALLSGTRNPDGSFLSIGSIAHFWTSSEYSGTCAWGRTLYVSFATVGRHYHYKTSGFPVRCMRDIGNQPPETPSSPNPEDEAENQSIESDISWTCSDPEGDPLTYDVYFGTEATPPQVATGQTEKTYDPGTLENETEYFWKVVAHDDHSNTTEGPVWSFTTGTGGTWQCGDPFTDPRDGQTYETVQIGTQCWMAENLNIGTMINGSSNQTDNGTIEKYCYNNSTSNCDTYGGLYQWNEMMQYTTTQGVQGICPDGWHLPTDAEWTTLEDFLGGSNVAGGKMKEAGTTHWNFPNTGATNESGFTALPGGYRNTNGNFSNLGYGAYFWSSTEYNTYYAWFRYLYYNYADVYRYNNNKNYGFSVRCFQD